MDEKVKKAIRLLTETKEIWEGLTIGEYKTEIQILIDYAQSQEAGVEEIKERLLITDRTIKKILDNRSFEDDSGLRITLEATLKGNEEILSPPERI